MIQALQNLKIQALKELGQANNLDELEKLRVKYLGRSSELSKFSERLASLSVEDRKMLGRMVNDFKAAVEEILGKKSSILTESNGEQIDLTLPGIESDIGHLHPLTQFMRRVVGVFEKMGYEVVDGPGVETEEMNFDLLNVPKDHPARDMHDTFWLAGTRTQEHKNTRTERFLLRTHTSPVQLRAMRERKPPVRLIVPGRVFRHEATDAGHETTFYQCEGLVIDQGIRITDLFGTLEIFLKEIFGSEVKVRVRPHYYPFVEPGFDVDMSCLICRGKGCSVCKRSGWLEMLGSGMVHPQVLRNMKVDPRKFSGFAFGLGIDRFMMLYYGVRDIRLSYGGDLRFIKQF